MCISNRSWHGYFILAVVLGLLSPYVALVRAQDNLVPFLDSKMMGELRSLPIKSVIFRENECQITHNAENAVGQRTVRVNVPDINTAAFLNRLETKLGCRVDPWLTESAAPRLYPSVSSLQAGVTDVRQFELLKLVVGSRITVGIRQIGPETKSASDSQTTDPPNNAPKHNSSVIEVVEGVLIGVTGDAPKFMLTLKTDAASLREIASGEILSIDLDQQGNTELEVLVNLIRGRVNHSKQMLVFEPDAPNGPISVSYVQPISSEHKAVVEIFSTHNSLGKTLEDSSLWITLWNDTFYDWKKIEVTVNVKNESYILKNVSLPFGQRQAFKVQPAPKLELQTSTDISVTGTSAIAKTMFHVSATLDTVKDLSALRWTIRDKNQNELVANALGTLEETGEVLLETNIPPDVAFEFDPGIGVVPIKPQSRDEGYLNCQLGKLTKFTFLDEINEPYVDRSSIMIKLSTGAKVEVKLVESEGKVECVKAGNELYCRQLNGSAGSVELSLSSVETSLLIPMTLFTEQDPDVNLDSIVSKKQQVDNTRIEFAKLLAERERVLELQRKVPPSPNQTVIQRNMSTQLQQVASQLRELSGELAHRLDELRDAIQEDTSN